MRSVVLALASLLPVTAFAADPGGPITCSSPIAGTETAKTLKAKYGKNAVIKTVPGAEGQDAKALVLYPKDKKHELIISFYDDAMTQLSNVEPGEGATGWTIAGLSVASGLEDVQKANGKNFDVAGFNWDYGGYVTSWHGGALDKFGCSVIVRLGTSDNTLPPSMSGDGVKIKSNNPRLAEAKPKIQTISVGFAAPK